MGRLKALLFLLILSGCSVQRLPESNSEFAVSPFSIIKSNHSVVQNFEARLHIYSNEHAVFHIRKVITVLNPDARNTGKLVLPYDSFRKIKNVDGAIYSKSGKLIRRLNDNDGIDRSLFGGYSLYDDIRIKIYELYYNVYPYTVVYDYNVEYNGLLNLPVFYPQNRNQYVEKASLEVLVPKNLRLKYYTINVESAVEKRSVEGDSIFTWQLKSLKPFENEPYGPSFFETAPRILLATETFKIGGTKGSLDTWSSFGQWYYSLSKDRNDLPQATIEEVRTIFNKTGTVKQGIKALYKYMQNKTRYISIQLGIGGWQPFKAGYVEDKGYGDCKALVNYMQAILSYVDVEAYPVLIRNGIEVPEIVTGFPSNQFNHVVLWIPEADTLWLETTSQTMPFNYIGYSNSGRYGLAVTPAKSFLIKTPFYGSRINTLKSYMKVNLNDNGDANIIIQTAYSGFYLDRLLSAISNKAYSERRKWIYKQLPLNSFRIKNVDFSDIGKRKREPELSYEIYDSGYATKTGSRLFIPVNQLNKSNFDIPAMSKERTQEIYLGYSFSEIDRTLIIIPAGFDIEAIPNSIDLKTSFGIYQLQLSKKSDNQIKIIRILKIIDSKLPASKYDEFHKFFEKVKDYDNNNIVLKAR